MSEKAKTERPPVPKESGPSPLERMKELTRRLVHVPKHELAPRRKARRKGRKA